MSERLFLFADEGWFAIEGWTADECIMLSNDHLDRMYIQVSDGFFEGLPRNWILI